MKDKENQIEEMAKLDIEESAGFYSAFIDDMRISRNKPIGLSKTIMTFHCPKKYIKEAIGIPKDSVVLSREEYEDYKKYVDNRIEEYYRGQHEAEVYYKNIQIPRERKETAEKFLQLAYDRCLEKSFIKKVEELAKTLGAEIKE